MTPIVKNIAAGCAKLIANKIAAMIVCERDSRNDAAGWFHATCPTSSACEIARARVFQFCPTSIWSIVSVLDPAACQAHWTWLPRPLLSVRAQACFEAGPWPVRCKDHLLTRLGQCSGKVQALEDFLQRVSNGIPRNIHCWKWLLHCQVGEGWLPERSHGLFSWRNSACQAVCQFTIHVPLMIHYRYLQLLY